MTTSVAPAQAGTPSLDLVGFHCATHPQMSFARPVAPGEQFRIALSGALEMIDGFIEPGRSMLLELHARYQQLAAANPLPVLPSSEPEVSWRIVSQHASRPATAIAGADVVRLLRDIGEASANDNSTELFGLLLGAQGVLSTTTPDEVALLDAYRRMEASARRDMLGVIESVAEQFPANGSGVAPAGEHGGAQ